MINSALLRKHPPSSQYPSTLPFVPATDPPPTAPRRRADVPRPHGAHPQPYPRPPDTGAVQLPRRRHPVPVRRVSVPGVAGAGVDPACGLVDHDAADAHRFLVLCRGQRGVCVPAGHGTDGAGCRRGRGQDCWLWLCRERCLVEGI